MDPTAPPCGLTGDDARRSTKNGLQLCEAVGSDGNQCGRRLADHLHTPPGINILLS